MSGHYQIKSFFNKNHIHGSAGRVLYHPWNSEAEIVGWGGGGGVTSKDGGYGAESNDKGAAEKKGESTGEYTDNSWVRGIICEEKEEEAACRDLTIQGLFERGSTTIIDIWDMDTDASSYLHLSTDKILKRQDQPKKKNFLKLWSDKHRHFVPYIFSVDELLGRKAQAVNWRKAQKLP